MTGTTHVDVVIVGAGMSGLYAAFRLQQAGVSYVLLEAAERAGGRVSSRPETFTKLGLVLDEGANLVNSTDTLAIKLLHHFDIPYVRRLKPGSDSMNYLYNGQLYDQEQFDALLFQDSRTAINQILHDQDIWNADTQRGINPKFIDESMASYLTRIGAGTALRTMLKSFFWSEYGHGITELNLHVLFDYVEVDLACPCFKLIPNVDEAYTVPGGLGQVAKKLEELSRDSLLLKHTVTRIDDSSGFVQVFAKNATGDIQSFTGGQAFFSAPLHSLARIDVNVTGVSQDALMQASRATYARGTKLHLKFEDGFDRYYPFSGIILTDTGEQIWKSSTGQGEAGLLTVLTGPLPAGRAAAVQQAGHVLAALDSVMPGLSDHYVGVERSDAPMSYSGSLMPGEIADLKINQGAMRWTTVGEASGHELQGYLEGALRSAESGVARYLAMRELMAQ